MRVFCVLIILLGLATPALADRASYCQAYARDFSDQRASDKDSWQHKFQIALDACLASHKQSAAKPVVTTQRPGAANTAPKAVAAQPRQAPAKAAVKSADVVQPAAGGTKPVPGSQAWNDYCTKKYTSFNVKTGMYLSHTGVQRRCVFTTGAKG